LPTKTEAILPENTSEMKTNSQSLPANLIWSRVARPIGIVAGEMTWNSAIDALQVRALL